MDREAIECVVLGFEEASGAQCYRYNDLIIWPAKHP
jgi:hypothetical protein